MLLGNNEDSSEESFTIPVELSFDESLELLDVLKSLTKSDSDDTKTSVSNSPKNETMSEELLLDEPVDFFDPTFKTEPLLELALLDDGTNEC